MSVIFNNFPNKPVNGVALLDSRWSSVHQPIKFSGRRQDQSITQVQYLAGYHRVSLPGAPPAGLNVGDKVFISSGGVSVEAFIIQIGATSLKVSGSLPNYSTGGYINYTTLKRNYYIKIRVYVVDETNTYKLIGTHEVRPAPSGAFDFDAHGYLKSYVDLGDSFLYNAINKKQVRQGSSFNISTQEFWSTGSSSESTMSSTTKFYWANGIKQLQQRYNFNLGQFVLFPSIDTAKFLVDFEKPTYFPGFPFSLSFIWSDKVAGRQLQRVEDRFSVPVVTNNLDASQGEAVNRMMLSGSYSATQESIDVWLNDNGVTTIGYVAPGYVGSGYVKPIPPLVPVSPPITG